MKKLQLNVQGMHCKSCEMLIADTLQEAGAHNISASFKDGKVKVEYDESKLNESKIRAIIEKEGYKVK